MGLVDRARRAADALLEHARVLDVLVDDDRDATARRATPPEGAPTRARRPDAPDPATLLTAAEAAAVLGSPVDAGRPTGGDDTTGVAFRSTGDGPDGEVAVVAFHAAEVGAPFDPAEHWYGFVEGIVADEGRPVPGLGRAAVRTDGGLYVLGATALLHLSLRTERPRDGEDGLVELAARVLGRLEGGDRD